MQSGLIKTLNLTKLREAKRSSLEVSKQSAKGKQCGARPYKALYNSVVDDVQADLDTGGGGGVEKECFACVSEYLLHRTTVSGRVVRC